MKNIRTEIIELMKHSEYKPMTEKQLTSHFSSSREDMKILRNVVSDLEKEFPCSGEINLPASHVDRVMQAVEKEYAKDAKEIQHIDGLGMDFGEWRFNLRASNTEPLIRFNMETRGDKLLLEEKKKAIMEFIKNQN